MLFSETNDLERRWVSIKRCVCGCTHTNTHINKREKNKGLD